MSNTSKNYDTVLLEQEGDIKDLQGTFILRDGKLHSSFRLNATLEHKKLPTDRVFELYVLSDDPIFPNDYVMDDNGVFGPYSEEDVLLPGSRKIIATTDFSIHCRDYNLYGKTSYIANLNDYEGFSASNFALWFNNFYSTYEKPDCNKFSFVASLEMPKSKLMVDNDTKDFLTNPSKSNTSIAVYMGHKVKKLGLQFWYCRDNESYLPEYLNYHTHISWLFPVIEKIERSGFVDEFNIDFDSTMGGTIVTILPAHKGTFYPIVVEQKSSKIETMWIAVVKFIEWYNEYKNSFQIALQYPQV